MHLGCAKLWFIMMGKWSEDRPGKVRLEVHMERGREEEKEMSVEEAD